MLMIDLFSGLKGASQYAKELGWKVFTVDINEEFEPDIIMDIKEKALDHILPEKIDLIWASPPCDEFSRESMPWCKTGKLPDLSLVFRSIELANILKPKYWILENVRGLQRYLGRASCHAGPFYFWGWFPKIKFNGQFYFKEKLFPSKDRKALRAKIPYEVSKQFIDRIMKNL